MIWKRTVCSSIVPRLSCQAGNGTAPPAMMPGSGIVAVHIGRRHHRRPTHELRGAASAKLVFEPLATRRRHERLPLIGITSHGTCTALAEDPSTGLTALFD